MLAKRTYQRYLEFHPNGPTGIIYARFYISSILWQVSVELSLQPCWLERDKTVPEICFDVVGIITPFNAARFPHLFIVSMIINIAPRTADVTIWVATMILGFADRWIQSSHTIFPWRTRSSGFRCTLVSPIFSAELRALAFESMRKTRDIHNVAISNFLWQILNRKKKKFMVILKWIESYILNSYDMILLFSIV